MRRLGLRIGVAVLTMGIAGNTAAKEAVDPATGVDFKPRQGFFLESQVGVFYTLLGSKVISNTQPYLGVTLGLDVPGVSGLSVFASAGQGLSAGSCRAFDPDDRTLCENYPGQSPAMAPDSFSVIPLELGGRFTFAEVLPRFSLSAALVAGYSLITPQVTDTAATGSPHAGAAFGLEYGTRLSGLSIGADVLCRAAFAPMIPSLTITPRVRYVF